MPTKESSVRGSFFVIALCSAVVHRFFVRRIILLLPLFLVACGNQPEPAIPFGPATMTGTLQRSEISLMRRGTHVLLQQGIPVVYIESRSGSLLAAEGHEVVVSGVVGPNTDRDDLPVLSAQNMRIVVADMKALSLPKHKLRLSVPATWKPQDAVSLATGNALLTHFTDTASTSPDAVLLTVSSMSGTVLPSGTSLSIGGQPAVRSVLGDQESYALMRSGVVLTVTPSSQLSGNHPALLRDILGSIAFVGSPSQSTSHSSVSAASVGPQQPCGGPAGILCPSGSVCIITDAVQSVGYCKSLK